MVEDQSLDAVFHALSSAPRRRLLGELTAGDRTVGTLAGPFDMSLAAVSKHIRVLEEAGLVQRRTEGRTTICSLQATPLAEVRAWVDHYERFWNAALDRLGQLLDEREDER